MKIPLSRPDITESDRERVLEVLNTPNLSLGPKLGEFEERFADYVGTRYSIAVNSGTSGLHLCIRALNIKDGDEVLTTPFSFISSANCILFERAKPVFVDIDENTLNMNINIMFDAVNKPIAKIRKLKAILPVHIFGRPCEMDHIMKLAQESELKVIEDSCEAIGAEYISNPEESLNLENEKPNESKAWKKVGTFGECGVFAFYPNKQITTAEGGMIVTDDNKIYTLCKSMRNQGRSDSGGWLQHERLGYNYRLSEMNCALGISQLERIDKILTKREEIAQQYKERLKEIEGVVIPQFEENKKISWFVYVVRLTDEFSRKDRDEVLAKLKEKGIGCSNYFSPIHLQPFYRKMFGYREGDFPVTERISERTIALPFYNKLREEQIDYVCENLKNIIESK